MVISAKRLWKNRIGAKRIKIRNFMSVLFNVIRMISDYQISGSFRNKTGVIFSDWFNQLIFVIKCTAESDLGLFLCLKALNAIDMEQSYFSVPVTPDWEGLLNCIGRKGTPERVHHIELFLDDEIKDIICDRFGLLDGIGVHEPFFDLKKEIRIQRFLGYDYVRCGLDDFEMPLDRLSVADTAKIERVGGREFINEKEGPITSWEEFEKYPWADPGMCKSTELEWYEKNLPEDMCIIGSGGFAHFAEYLSWLMGYETLCYALYENRNLVGAISRKLEDIYEAVIWRLLSYERVKIIWGSDDMGFKGGPLISPDDLREFVLPGHKLMADLSHQAGRPYLLHSCGKLDLIMEDLIDAVGIDARHSFEDTIEDVLTANSRYGNRIAILGGIDVDFLCRSSEQEIRNRVRQTLDAGMPGGGYCLGSGNSIANYIPVDNFLVMLDEGRKYIQDLKAYVVIN
jgi:uroporphyrinogen decarboxylase